MSSVGWIVVVLIVVAGLAFWAGCHVGATFEINYRDRPVRRNPPPPPPTKPAVTW